MSNTCNTRKECEDFCGGANYAWNIQEFNDTFVGSCACLDGSQKGSVCYGAGDPQNPDNPVPDPDPTPDPDDPTPVPAVGMSTAGQVISTLSIVLLVGLAFLIAYGPKKKVFLVPIVILAGLVMLPVFGVF
uniref:Uncharacterized protein n=1 Tax=viral metagenome TaxID=1070528 RepID=A0A6C0BNY6_9ZZZZ